MRDIAFRYTIIRNGADYGMLNPADNSAPTLRMDESGEIKTSFSADFLPTVYALDGRGILPDGEVNWLSDAIRPEIVLDGIPHPLGVYLPATVQTRENTKGRSIHVDAYDRCWIVRDHNTADLTFFGSGVNYLTAVETLLTRAGISLISKTDTTATLTEGRQDWDIGTSFLTIINQLLSEINYNPLWFDQNGLAILEPASVPSAENIEHTLDAENPETKILPAITRQMDIYSAPNVFTCICNNADKGSAMVATSENTNPQSSLSIPQRGRRIQKVVHVDNIASQNELQAYADRLRNESMITGETITVETDLLPGFGVNDVTALSYGEVFAVCIERAWAMQLTVGGKMTHTLEKLVINLV